MFVSYTRQDGEAYARTVVERLKDLEGHDLDVWLDRHRMRGGEQWWQQIRSAIDRASVSVLVVTAGAERSDVVRREWLYARNKGYVSRR